MKSYFVSDNLYVGRPGLVRQVLTDGTYTAVEFMLPFADSLPCQLDDGIRLVDYMLELGQDGRRKGFFAPVLKGNEDTDFFCEGLYIKAPRSVVVAVAINGDVTDLRLQALNQTAESRRVAPAWRGRQLIAHLATFNV